MAQAVNDQEDEIEICGTVTIEFSDKDTIEIKQGSWLHVKLEDTSLMDAPSKTLATTSVLVKAGKYKKDEISIKYSIKCQRPNENQRMLRGGTTLSAVLNNGWDKNKNKDEWIRKGDCLTTSQNHVIIDHESKKIEKDLKVQLYS